MEEAVRTLNAEESVEDLDSYLRDMVAEADRRGVRYRIIDAEDGYVEWSHGGETVLSKGAVTERTSAIALSLCDDKRVTRKVLGAAGLRVPKGRMATFDEADEAFLDEVGEIVVKPTTGIGGEGITVGVRTAGELAQALEDAGGEDADILLEECVEGSDCRLVVIDGELVAAAVRRPAHVTGDGERTVAELIEARSAERAEATGGAAEIPLDAHLHITVERAGYAMDDVLPDGEELEVRRTANIHAGGTIRDVTPDLHPELAKAALRIAELLELPVVGVDFLVPDVGGGEYVFIEANERPGLSNHEPQPVIARWFDWLLPSSAG